MARPEEEMASKDSPEFQRYLLSCIESVGPVHGLILTLETHFTSAPVKYEHFQLGHLFDTDECDGYVEQTCEETSVLNQTLIPQDCFVGRGYDKKEKEPKWGVTLFKVRDSKPLKHFESLFQVPVKAEIFDTSVVSLQYEDRFKENKSSVGGGGAFVGGVRVPALFNGDTNGNLTGTSSSSNQETKCFVGQNLHLYVLRMTEPWNQEKSDDFIKALGNLPPKFSTRSKIKVLFLDFIKRWGTHVVIGQTLGGNVQIIDNSQGTTNTREISTGQKANTRLAKALDASVSSEFAKVSNKAAAESLQTIIVKGGDPTLNNNEEWSGSVKHKPSALIENPDLKPIYDFLEGHQQTALRQATEYYLSDKDNKRRKLISKFICR